jgi:hypothetical protein
MKDVLGQRSHLFTVRLWLEPIGERQMEVRGRVCHVLNNETHYFRNLSGLVKLLEEYFDTNEEEETP